MTCGQQLTARALGKRRVRKSKIGRGIVLTSDNEIHEYSCKENHRKNNGPPDGIFQANKYKKLFMG